MAPKTGPDAELAGHDGIVIVDVKMETFELRPALEQKVNADNARITDQTRDAVGRRVVMIGDRPFTDDGENLAPAGRTPSTAFTRSTNDYGA